MRFGDLDRHSRRPRNGHRACCDERKPAFDYERCPGRAYIGASERTFDARPNAKSNRYSAIGARINSRADACTNRDAYADGNAPGRRS